MIYPLLPLFLTTVLGAGPAFLGLIEGVAESTAALLKLISGVWADRVRNRAPLVLAGYSLSSLCRPFVAAATTPGAVLAVRFADRVGKGIRTSPRDAMLADAVEASLRGKAFGFHRAMDHAGAVLGPIIATGLLVWGCHLRTVFWLAAIPGVFAVALILWRVRDVQRDAAPVSPEGQRSWCLPSRTLWPYLGVLLLFTLGNSSDAFLLLRAGQLGVTTAALPLLWVAFHVVKMASSMPGGALSDRIGRKTVIVAGWVVYALTYAGFAMAQVAWHMWGLFLVYGLFYGLTEGTERALLADVASASDRGAAFGWYNGIMGLGALPASLICGWLWQRCGAPAAFGIGAGLAAVAAALLLLPAVGRTHVSAH